MAHNRWDEIEAVIAEHKSQLKDVDNHHELKKFAEDNGWMNKNDFGKFKHLLKKIGVDYNELREQTFADDDARRAEQLDNLPATAATIHLWSAAIDDDETGSFALVDASREVVWYGSFFDNDRHYQPGDLVSAEQSVAHKAVWVAHKALEAAGENAGQLEIVTTCPHLDTDALAADGARSGVKVTITVDDDDDRAVRMAETPGFQSWKDADLAGLITAGTDDEEEDE